MPVPDSPADDAWTANVPGPGCTVEDLRWYCIREFGAIKDSIKASSVNLHQTNVKVEVLDGRVATKAEAERVQVEFDNLRQQVGNELAKSAADIDSVGTNAKLTNMGDLIGAFSTQVQEAFQHVTAVETSFQAHVSQNFSEAVTALKWLEETMNGRFNQVEQKMVQGEAAFGSATYAPPPATHPTARPVPSGRAAASFSVLGGCAAGPYACGCGSGAVAGEGTSPVEVPATTKSTGDSLGGPPGPPGFGGQVRSTHAGDADECHCHHVTTSNRTSQL